LSGSLTEPFACGRFKHPIGLRIPTFIRPEQREPRFVSVETSILLAKFDHSEMVRYPAWRSQPDRARRLARSIDLENAVKIEQGMPNPLGFTWNGRGANFALFSAFPLEGAAPLA
jgi:hypothetical protein